LESNMPQTHAEQPEEDVVLGARAGFLGTATSEIIARALKLAGLAPEDTSLPADQGVRQLLQQRAAQETEPDHKQRYQGMLNDLATFYQTSSHDPNDSNDGRIVITTSNDGQHAYLTLTPPRGPGSVPTRNRVLAALQKIGIRHGVDIQAINQAVATVRKDDPDIVWRTVIATGTPPIPGKPRRLRFSVNIVNKRTLREAIFHEYEEFGPVPNVVREGDVIGRLLLRERGKEGVDIYGDDSLPPAPPILEYLLSDAIYLSHGVMTAQHPGAVFMDGNQVDIIPMYIVRDPKPGLLKDFAYPGAVLVLGNLEGPGQVRCDDLIVTGDCENIEVSSSGDVFILGGITGHNETRIDADGDLFANFISEADVSALGNVSIVNAIVNSRVISNGMVRVSSEQGMISGGSIQALRGVSVYTIGSEFGLFTETIVGKDFLTEQRLKDFSETIRQHEENLRRIMRLKMEVSKARVALEQLPPDKQELYIGVLRKEKQSRSELSVLTRRRARLSSRINEFLSASIQILEELFPPVRVQIVDEIKEFRERMHAVTLKYDASRGIVSDAIYKPQRDHDEKE
jgi:hypothetical protein